MKINRRHSGFTLIEVLATLVLLGIVLPVALHGISLALAAASHAKHLSEATGLAEQKIAELTSGDLAQSGGTGSGDFGADHPGFQWTSQSTQRDYGLTQIDVRVTWQERAKETGLVVSTMYNPTAALDAAAASSGTSTTGTGTTGGAR